MKAVNHYPRGAILILILVFSAISILLITGLANWSVTNLKLVRYKQASELAFQIAEAGVNYYRWHLAHAPQDYQDGTGQPGPYVHPFYDKDGNVIGQFSLEITPPPVGTTLVVITSTGSTIAYPEHKRVIKVKMAIPSLAKYAVVANADMRFGTGTEIFGPVHSNGGIRFDGLIHNLITSAKEKYDDPDHSGANEFGVHTHVSPVDPLPPAAVPSRPDVFAAGRQFPSPAVDFPGLSADLAQIKTDAQASGVYLANSGSLGYHIVLKTSDTFDLYLITQLYSPGWGCYSSQDGWGTWSIRNETWQSNNPLPANGLIFVEDNVWVSGNLQTARLTIASARFPEKPNTNTSITVNNDILYTTYDGQETLALLAQKNINIGLYSEDDLQIDGALVAKNGRVGRYYYDSSCGANYLRQKITLNGMIASNQRYGFAYTDGTGYQIRNINYDTNLLYGPPPSFPLTSDQYELLSWEEVK